MALPSASTWARAVVSSELFTFLNKLGATTPASRPMMASTTRSSRRVKPFFIYHCHAELLNTLSVLIFSSLVLSYGIGQSDYL